MSACCPKCGSKSSEVTNSKHLDEGDYERRRKCGLCGFRFSTVELALDRFSPMKKLVDAIGSIKWHAGSKKTV